MSTTRVSVVIPCHEYGRYLVECVNSVLAQDHENLEVLIVDDGSTDRTPQVAADLARTAGTDAAGRPRVRLLRQANSGQPAIARNRGIALTDGPYVLCLDADDRIGDGFVRALADRLDRDRSIGIAYPDQLNFGAIEGFEAHPEYAAENLPLYNFIPPASMFRREVWDEIGGFRENVIGYEDWDFWVAALARGVHGHRVPAAVWEYRRHPGGLYERQKGRDRLLKAQVVHNNPSLYGPMQRRWAEAVTRGEALDLGTAMGVVPAFHGDVRPPAPAPRQFSAPDAADPAGSAAPGSSLRVLFTMCGWNEEGGGTILPRGIARRLAAEGHQVTVLYTSPSQRPDLGAYAVERRREDGVDLVAVHNRAASFADPREPGRELDEPRMRRLCRDLVAEIRPELVHVHSMLSFSAGFLEDLAVAGIPAVYTSHNYWPICPRMYLFQEDLGLCSGPDADGGNCAACNGKSEAGADYAARKEGLRRAFELGVRRHFAVSRRVRDLFVANGHDPERIEVLTQVPETADALWRDTGRLRRPVPKLDRPLRVGFVGSLLAQKGVHVLARALQALPAGSVEARIFGSGPDAYLQILRGIDRAGAMRFEGRFATADLPRLLGEVDVLVVPSIWEDCAPLVVAEGLAAGLPVIGSRIGGIPDFIEHGRNGLLVEPRDTAGLAAALRRFQREPDLLGRLQAGIVPPRPFGEHVQDLLQRYREVLSSAPRDGAQGAEVAGRPAPKVVWEGSQFLNHSLAIINREVCSRLVDRGVDLGVNLYEAHEPGVGDEARFDGLRKAFGRRPEGPVDVHVRHQWPPRFDRPASGRWVMIQPWEFGSLPETWLRPMRDEVDEIWVPTHFVKAGYVESGIPAAKIQVIPNGVDADLFRPSTRPMPLATNKGFRFLFVGGTIPRKGIHGLLEAYGRSFGAADDVCLVIKDQGNRSVYRGHTAEAAIAAFRARPNAPEILHLVDDFDATQMAGLYAACQALVQPYLGEGFGMPIIEAMSSGLPVVVTGYGAALDFCNDENAWLIPAVKQSFPERRVGDLVTVAPPHLARPDLEALGGILRRLLVERAEAQARAHRARLTVLEGYTWEKVVDRIQARLAELAGGSPERPVARPLPASGGANPVEARDLDAIIEAALLHRRAGRIDEASRCAVAALEIAPGDLRSLGLYAGLCREVGYEEGLARALARLRELDPAGELTRSLEPAPDLALT